MIQKYIYIVMGVTGEFSDRTEWPVIAFTKEEKAQKHVLQAETLARRLFKQYKDELYKIPQGSNIYDPNMHMDYTGVFYHYKEVELLDDK